MVMENSFCEKPVRCDSRRLSDYLKLDGKRKVHLADTFNSRRESAFMKAVYGKTVCTV
jgi:predicted dehydrogenase